MSSQKKECTKKPISASMASLCCWDAECSLIADFLKHTLGVALYALDLFFLFSVLCFLHRKQNIPWPSSYVSQKTPVVWQKERLYSDNQLWSNLSWLRLDKCDTSCSGSLLQLFPALIMVVTMRKSCVLGRKSLVYLLQQVIGFLFLDFFRRDFCQVCWNMDFGKVFLGEVCSWGVCWRFGSALWFS